MITTIEQNQKGEITKAKLVGELPTDTDIYASNCFLYKFEDPSYFLYVNKAPYGITPIWLNEGICDFIETIPQANSIGTANLIANSIVKTKVSYAVKSVTVAPTATFGESTPDPTIAAGEILGYYPTGNQDQFVTNVEITVGLTAKITLGSAATAPNTFNVVILKAA